MTEDREDNVALASELWRAQQYLDELMFEFEEITGLCYDETTYRSKEQILKQLREARP